MLSVASVSPNLVSASVLRKLLFNVTIPENEMLPSASSASEYAMSSTDLQSVSSHKPRVLSVPRDVPRFSERLEHLLAFDSSER